MIRGLIIKRYGDPNWTGPMAEAVLARRPQSEAVRRVAMHQHTPEEWDMMITKARYDYRKLYKRHGRLYGAVVGAWAGLWAAIFAAYEYLSAWNREE